MTKTITLDVKSLLIVALGLALVFVLWYHAPVPAAVANPASVPPGTSAPVDPSCVTYDGDFTNDVC